MANYLVTDTDLTSVANAIRTKGGTSASLTFPSGFVSAIQNIPSGGSGWQDITSAFNLSDISGQAFIRFAMFSSYENMVIIFGDIEEDSRHTLEVIDPTYYPADQPSVCMYSVGYELVDTWQYDDPNHTWEFEMYSGYGDGYYSIIYGI